MLQLRFLGVGDGDSIAIRFPDGQCALVDSCMRHGVPVPPALRHLRNTRVAFCCLTHPHFDHFGGMYDILSDNNVTVEEFWYALSDLDYVLEALNHVRKHPGAAFAGRAAQEAVELVRLFSWVEGQNVNVPRLIMNVHHAEIGGVGVYAFGPRVQDWNRYRRALSKQRDTGKPFTRERANAISLVLMLRYAGHSVWLLGDLTSVPLQRLPGRATPIVQTPEHVRACVLKVSHHGARNATFEQIADSLTRCQPDDLIVFSASGNGQHPHRSVWQYWSTTGKRLCTTYKSARAELPALVEGAGRNKVESIIRPANPNAAQDVIVSIHESGTIDLNIEDTQID